MNGSPLTRPSLLLRIRDPDDDVAWHDFVTIYTPLIYAYARRRGLQDADAADLSQSVLESISRSINGFNYDASRGTFRAWLFTIVRNQVSKNLQKKQRLPIATGKTLFPDSQSEMSTDDEDYWNRGKRSRQSRRICNVMEYGERSSDGR